MAKRHYSHEHRGTHSERDGRHMTHHSERSHEHYAEGSMISEDRSAPCNLPRTIVEKNYPSYQSYEHGEMIPDLYIGVEKMLGEDSAGMRRIMKPSKMGSKG